MNKNFDMQAFQMRTTLVDPEEVEYYLNQGRFVTTKKIFGKRWLRSHLVYAYKNFLTLATLQLLLDLGWFVHHKDGNPQNDTIENLKLIKGNEHKSLHNSGKNHPFYGKNHSPITKIKMSRSRKGRKFSSEWRQKLSQARKGKYCGKNHPNYRHDVKDETIIKLIKESKSTEQVAKELSIRQVTIYRRLKKLGYEFIQNKWILKNN